MAMPIDLVFVRHGEAEHNLASSFSRRGDNSLYTPEFRSRTNSQYRLTPLGRRQAKAAGKWLNQHGLGQFDRRYVSDYVRAKETAALLGLKGSDWFVNFLLREREWGDYEGLLAEERQEMVRQSVNLKETDPFYWIPPNGESIAQLTVRLRPLFATFHRECFDMRVVVVCHGEVMSAFRQMIERMPLEQWTKWNRSDNPKDHIYNCQIIHYTRRNPKNSELSTHLDWVRSVCPWDESLSTNKWQKIERQRFSDQQLLKFVEKFKPLFKNIKRPRD